MKVVVEDYQACPSIILQLKKMFFLFPSFNIILIIIIVKIKKVIITIGTVLCGFGPEAQDSFACAQGRS